MNRSLALSSAAAALAVLVSAQPTMASTGVAMLTLNADQACYDATRTTMTVTIDVSNLGTDEVCGGQFFLEYDHNVLDFVSATPDADFPIVVLNNIDEVNGLIDYGVGVMFGDSGTSADSTMATLTFDIDPAAEICIPATGLITFRVHDPPTRLTDCLGIQIPHISQNLPAVTIDTDPPAISTIPDPFVVDASTGGCTGTANLSATATDNCDITAAVSFLVDLNGNGFDDDTPSPSPRIVEVPEGTTPARATATDSCGNVTNVDFDIQFNPITELDVTVELSPNINTGDAFPQTLSRAITFELHEAGCTGSLVICEVIDFTVTNGTETQAIGMKRFTIPCGEYTCIEARDPLHALRRMDADDFGISGDQYVANFTDESEGLDDDSLIGGDLNADGVIDILDFGVFAGEFGTNYDGASYGVTTCVNAYEDISATGTLAPIASDTEDGGDTGIPIGFSFDFFGDSHTDIGIASNGYLTFGTDVSDFTTDPIPDSEDPNDLIAPYWGDYSTQINGDVLYETIGTAGNQRFIVQWDNVEVFGGADGELANFQAVLFESSDCIEFRYADPLFFDNNAVTGIENQDGTVGAAVDASTIVPGDCIQFCLLSGGNTACNTPAPHADISGNGLCGVEDFTFVSGNFLSVSDTSCCTGASGGSGGSSFGLGSTKAPPALLDGSRRGNTSGAGPAPAPAPGPDLTLAISVEELYERGLPKSVKGDLNGDGWLDIFDMIAFMAGARPE